MLLFALYRLGFLYGLTHSQQTTLLRAANQLTRRGVFGPGRGPLQGRHV